MSDPRIEVDRLSVAFRVPRRPARSAKDSVVHLLRHGRGTETIWAIRDVSLTVQRGEIVGLVGANGAGKSTLLRCLAHVLAPSQGRVVVRGAVAPLLTLGAPFNPDLTGRENVIRFGALMGRDHREVERRAGAIAEWAGLSEYLDLPLRAYSSGMAARLAFGVATDGEPDVLLMDEIHAVGDAAFRAHSFERVERILARGASAILVSHSPGLIRERCSRIIWLDRGEVRAEGTFEEIAPLYRAELGRHRKVALTGDAEAPSEVPEPPRGDAARGL
ncbi:MAG: hypothetical protein AVDCRST_MAG85-590 [uncultured Solirubrobacteraceae bacterium]|uniref:ABC transporter domain-containing protein n=1 Tax=uncultured Solirubrobacteraceae bacterium TaxID=1162706 RepID=A0A6J4RQL3_9ACTN|nr:MAG: hypothetical protein AVDCRST_MAG85-590 [uncultured Solirubrobacteraceae bacterium]